MIGFAGMSHLGLVSSLCLASKRPVVAYDPDPQRIARLSQGDFPYYEPGLDQLWREHRERVRFTCEMGELQECPLVYLGQDLPPEGAAPVLELLARVAGERPPGSLLSLLSQLPPGTCRQWQARFPHIQVFYQVETLIFGQAVERALQPERIIVGCSDPGQPLPPLYGQLLESYGCPLLQMGYESAELTKTAINLYLIASVTTTNVLAELCERIGADWREIAPALRLDRRIGPHAYLAPGLGLSGGNLERDLAALTQLSARWGTQGGLLTAFRNDSNYRRHWVLRQLARQGWPSRLAIWGLAYKVGTDSTQNSPALALLEQLAGVEVRAYDPRVRPPGLGLAPDPLAACQGAQGLVVMTPYPELAQVPLEAVREALQGEAPPVLDPYQVLSGDRARALGLKYLTLGRP